MCCMSVFFFFKQKTAYEMRISDWSSDVCSSDLVPGHLHIRAQYGHQLYVPGKLQAGGQSLDGFGGHFLLVEIQGVGGRRRRKLAGVLAICCPRDRKSTRLNSSH